MMSERPDQLRDKEAIQRDCISAKLLRGVIPKVYVKSTKNKMIIYLDLCEPNSSNNTASAKFSLRVEEETVESALNSLGQILEDVNSAFNKARSQYLRKREKQEVEDETGNL